MTSRTEEAYRAALARLNVSEVARATTRAHPTLKAYLAGRRRVTDAAARELVAYLRSHAAELEALAAEIERGLEEEPDGT